MGGRRTYSDEEVDAAVQAISDPARLEEAQRVVTHSAPQLQQILYQALHDSDWFGQAHRQAVRQAVSAADAEDAVHRLIAEETRLTLLVGVAAGLELAHELENPTGGQTQT
ncbi:MAG: hypothetical protein QOE86_1413 [Solirubrobacteraceae bacterium]|jgi:hypothetical protein|nr:hypothetical protein [Solirubrobacteraceae bacterium]